MLKKFLRDRRANVLPMFAIATVPLIVAAGGVVDYTNAFNQRTVVQDAMDAAALAAGKKVSLLTTEEIQDLADQYFLANITPDKVTNVPDLDTSVGGSTVDIDTQLHVPTYFLGLIGLDEFVFDLHSQVTVAMGTLEVAFVLDNSGSMCAGCDTAGQANTSSKIGTLRTAASALVDTLFKLGESSTKPDPVKIAIVPFAGSVNIDPANRNSGWMDTTGVNPYHGENFEAASGSPPVSTNSPAVNVFNLYDAMSGSDFEWKGCVEERPAPYDVQDDEASVSTPATMFVPTFAPDEPDAWTCSTSTCNFAGTSNSTRRYDGAAASGSVFGFNNYLPDASGGTCANPFNTFTVTQANPAVLTKSSHGLSVGTEIVLNSTGSLYSGLTKGESYYVAPNTATNTFRLTSQSSGTTMTIAYNSGQTFTVSKASPAVITKNSHGLVAGDAIKVTTSGSLYTGMSNNGVYYVLSSSLATNTFRFSSSSGGSAVNTSGNQSGTHTYTREAVFTASNHGLAVGDAVAITTTGSLPTGLSASTTYYVRSVPSTSTFTLATSDGGSPIFPTGSASGTHRFFKLIKTTGSQSGTHNYALASRAAEWTCQSGSANCGGTDIGQSEQTALMGKSISASPLCKYGTSANKVTPNAVIVDISGYSDNYPGGPNLLCTTKAVQTLTPTKETAKSKIAEMIGAGATNITSGLMWGWRALSPTAPFTEGRAYTETDNQKIIILMTDGQNTYEGNSKFVVSQYGSWGYVWKSHLGTTSTNENTVQDKMDERTALACVNAKAAGIKIYTVAFQVSDTTTVNMLRDCASEPDMAFTSSNNAALLAAFTAIGDDISLLRIAQ